MFSISQIEIDWFKMPQSFQAFDARREWFYENLHSRDDNNEMMHIPPNEQDILLITRGK